MKNKIIKGGVLLIFLFVGCCPANLSKTLVCNADYIMVAEPIDTPSTVQPDTILCARLKSTWHDRYLFINKTTGMKYTLWRDFPTTLNAGRRK